MDYKVIISGRLEFGTDRNFEQVTKLYEHRRENYYRGEVIFKQEQLFQPETLALNLDRHIGPATERVWRHTVVLLQHIAEFAIAGDLNLWGIREGKPTEHWLIEPSGDKTAVVAFRQGRELIESGKEEEAKAALSQAIQKFERHALAYERRGFVNFKLRNFDDAVYDYTKSIDINPNKPEPYFGRGVIYLRRKEWKKAQADFELAQAKSIPHQNMHWRSRVFKADCLVEAGCLADAIKEYQFFLKRNFSGEHPLAAQVAQVAFACGKAHCALEDYKQAIECFRLALAPPASSSNNPTRAEVVRFCQLALQQAGQLHLAPDLMAEEVADQD